jgi:hypothetical protein
MVLSIVFLVLAFWSGGEKFRWFGEKTGGAIRSGSEKLGEKADAIKETKDTTTKKVNKWTGKKDPDEASGTPNGKKADGQKKAPGNAGDVNEDNGFLSDMWDSVVEKVKSWKKE